MKTRLIISGTKTLVEYLGIRTDNYSAKNKTTILCLTNDRFVKRMGRGSDIQLIDESV